MVEIAVKDIDESDLAPEDSDTERALVAKEENETHEKGKANEITVTYSTPIWLSTHWVNLRSTVHAQSSAIKAFSGTRTMHV